MLKRRRSLGQAVDRTGPLVRLGALSVLLWASDAMLWVREEVQCVRGKTSGGTGGA